MSSRLYVGNLSYQTTEQDLRDLFSGAGEVTSVTVIMDRAAGRSKGFGFVEMASEDFANRAIELFNEHSLHNRKLRVDFARPRESAPKPEAANRHRTERPVA